MGQRHSGPDAATQAFLTGGKTVSDGNSNSLKAALLEGLSMESGMPQRVDFTDVTHGEPPETGCTDFDMCFVFVLPGYHRHMRKQLEGRTPEQKRKIAALVKEAEQENESAEAKFLADLMDRSARRPDTGKNFADCADNLLRQFFVEGECKHEKDYELDRMSSLEDARIAAIDTFLNFIRRDEERFYSRVFTSVDKDEVIVCIKMLETTALRHAAESDYVLPLSLDAIKEDLKMGMGPGPGGLNGLAMQPAWIPFVFDQAPLFQAHRCEADPSCTSLLRKIDEIRLLYDRITDVIDIEGMKKWNMLVDYFPLHSKPPLEFLRKKWSTLSRWWCLSQPIDEVRIYFGENVALYFVFTEHVCRYTRYVALFGVLILIVDCVAGYFPSLFGRFATQGIEPGEKGFLYTSGGMSGVPELRFAMAIFFVIWCNVFVVHLRRKIRVHLLRWGSMAQDGGGVKKQLNPRFALAAKMMHSEVDSNILELNVPRPRRYRGRITSLVCSCLFIAVLFSSVSCFFKAQAYFYSIGKATGAKLVSYGLIIQIKVFTAIWTHVCRVLTDRECHPDLIDFDNSCALKTFYVQFINMYASFYYIAFLMQLWGDDSYKNYGTPWSYVTYQMFVTFGLYLAFSVYDLITPLYAIYSSRSAELKKLKSLGTLPADAKSLEYSYVELQTKMESFDGAKENDDYMDILAVFGFVLLFGITLPAGAVFAFIYIALQMRVDAWKLTKAMRRPYPRRAPKTWVWLRLTEQLVLMGVITNIGLVVFCVEPLSTYTLSHQCIALFVLVTFAVVFRIMLSWMFPEESEDEELALRRWARQQALANMFGFERSHEIGHLKLQGRTNIDFSNVKGLDISDTMYETPPK
eukprot:TRINITY_DN32533_c0_g1_i1.p1 TRINITY_DN32533_c0_g1~~TRINITY_DN32533_c0_g1_i1.p1  ORF type:complete len:878 (-),score=193.86 TRINITY_DN32533_c0_g1_i1:176-2755(-)